MRTSRPLIRRRAGRDAEMEGFVQRYRLGLFAAALFVLLGLSSVVIVDEGHQAVVERLGRPHVVVNRFGPQPGASHAGAVLRVPLIDKVVLLDRGLSGFTLPGQQVRTLDGQILELDTDATYRIIDPVRLVGRLKSPERIERQLGSILAPLLESELSQRSAAQIITPGSGGASQTILRAFDARARGFGIQIVDLRVGRAALGEPAMQALFERMRDRHQRDADAITAQSAQEAREIVAYAQAKAADILQQSAGRDPSFYGFYRALRSYEHMFGEAERKNSATIVIPPDSAYLRHFYGL